MSLEDIVNFIKVYQHKAANKYYCCFNVPLGSVAVSLLTAAAAARSCWWCPTLCDPTDGSPTGSSVPGILQARVLEWVAIAFGSSA